MTVEGPTGPPGSGRPLPASESRRLLRGEGRLVADLVVADALHLAVLRSPHASARILSVDRTALAGRPGIVEVDPETVAVTDYAVVHDSDRVLDPAIVAGQVVGAVAQGLGGALWEEMVHDEAGQPLTASLMDYALPRAADVPALRLDHLETPTPNPLGVKGAGEGGIIPVAAIVAAAVDDALAPWEVFCDRTPRVWSALSRWRAEGTRGRDDERAHA